MKANIAWSILSKGEPYGVNKYSRKVSSGVFKASSEKAVSMIDALIPYSNKLLKSFHVEKTLEIVSRSSLADRLKQLDKLNTYDKTDLVFPSEAKEVLYSTSYPTFNINLSCNSRELFLANNGELSIDCVVDTSLSTVSNVYGQYSYSVSNGLSSSIEIFPNIKVKISSDFADPFYYFTVHFVPKLSVDWVSIRKNMEKASPVWSDPLLKNVWNNDPLWYNKLSAFCLSAVELCRNV